MELLDNIIITALASVSIVGTLFWIAKPEEF